jgi:urea transport system permease protein
MTSRLLIRAFMTLAMIFCILQSVRAAEVDVRAAVAKFAEGRGYQSIEAAVDMLGATGDPAAALALNALSDGQLVLSKADSQIYVLDKAGIKLLDPVTGETADDVAGKTLEKLKIKNSTRRKISTALSGMTLLSRDRNIRLTATQTIFLTADANQLHVLETAMATETDALVKTRMAQARAAILLTISKEDLVLKEAITIIANRADRDALKVLGHATGKFHGSTETFLENSITSINKKLQFWNMAQNIWYGLSLSSVLLLAAIGLAITFGVMGVINMAHGEMVMLGAYSTYVVQQIFTLYFPVAAPFAFLAALPAAFLVSGLVGMLIEHMVIRHLYGRPLETLLATWGISLILQQGVRSIFGPTNKEVVTPPWMSGSIEIAGGFSLTLNRLIIVLFALTVFASLMMLMRKSAIGLQMRAVTQNRPMANAMGIASRRVDAMTFGLGSGIAGLAGVALSQIDNVSPNLGQSYIIDSFLVVVFGGVGNLWGTFAGALTLGVANKFLEPFAGAVLAKIFILVAVIIFIQKKPRGLFALKGRWVET